MSDVTKKSEGSVFASDSVIHCGAVEIARRIANREVSVSEVVETFITRIEQVDSNINAVVVPLFDEARAAAREADKSLTRGDSVGPLHGVPITVKECFNVAGTPSTIGLSARRRDIALEDAVVVQRLKRAGAIVLGKTNLSQLMFCHESDNPVYGRTNNPWDLDRSPGGSSGGEGAIIAAGGSPLGLASDMGGSIRQPGHACGVQGIKPTSWRFPTTGIAMNMRGMEAMAFQPGLMSRRVEDLTPALRVIANPDDMAGDPTIAPAALRDPADVRIESLRVGLCADDGYFTPSRAILRAVDEAAEILKANGAAVERFHPPSVEEAVELYCAILAADGGRALRRLLPGSEIDWRVSRLMLPTKTPRFLRPILFGILRLLGQIKTSRILAPGYPRSTDEYWRLLDQRTKYVERFYKSLDDGGFDALIFPPHGLPAMKHEDAVYLLPAASYCFVPNLIGLPAGVVAATRVQSDEQPGRAATRDWVDRLATKTDDSSAGLPIGVQVAARHWREDVVLAVMSALEKGFRVRPDYPGIAMT